MKLFPDFTSIPFDYLLISWVTNYVSNLFDMFIPDRTDRELPSLERLELKFGLSSEFFNKIPVRIPSWCALSCVKVARYSFSGPVPPKFEHKPRRHKQCLGKADTTVVLNKDENLLWSGLQWYRSCHSNEMMLLPILLKAVFLGTGNCSSKIIHRSFFLSSNPSF